MDGILLVPLGDIDPEGIEAIREALARTFHCEAETGERAPLPLKAHIPWRRQYDSTSILRETRPTRGGRFYRVLLVTGEDLYAGGLNFVFGEADTTTGAAVISLARLREEFYGNPPNPRLMEERAIKEAVHEIGHTLGLGHCPNPGCVMHFSNSLRDTDAKAAEFCGKCAARLKR